MPALEPLQPLLTAALFRPLGERLLALLRGLSPTDWTKPTIAGAWTVHDVAAHLLDTAWRRLAGERDGYAAPPPAVPPRSYEELVAFLDALNRTWVEAWRRTSPAILVECLASAEDGLARHLPTMDPFAPARFGVAWAGEASSPNWFDQARELTERWHHQQQIRLAVGAPPLAEPRFSRPVLETFLYALPHRYAALAAPAGTSLALAVAGAETYAYTLRRDADRWSLLRGRDDGATTTVETDEETAWRVLTRGLSAAEAGARSRVRGDAGLAAPLFETLAVMAVR